MINLSTDYTTDFNSIFHGAVISIKEIISEDYNKTQIKNYYDFLPNTLKTIYDKKEEVNNKGCNSKSLAFRKIEIYTNDGGLVIFDNIIPCFDNKYDLIINEIKNDINVKTFKVIGEIYSHDLLMYEN